LLFPQNMVIITGTSHAVPCTFTIIYTHRICNIYSSSRTKMVTWT